RAEQGSIKPLFSMVYTVGAGTSVSCLPPAEPKRRPEKRERRDPHTRIADDRDHVVHTFAHLILHVSLRQQSLLQLAAGESASGSAIESSSALQASRPPSATIIMLHSTRVRSAATSDVSSPSGRTTRAARPSVQR